MQQELYKIQTSIEGEFQGGIQDQSRLLYHLAQEKNYRLIFFKIVEYKEKINQSIDILRKKNNISKQEVTIYLFSL